jgi:hypothetical protein
MDATVRVQELSNGWVLARDPQNRGREEGWFGSIRAEAVPAPVPGIIQQVFPAYHGVTWYWRAFNLPCPAGAGERVVLRFGAVDYLAEVWVNGNPVGGYEGGETPFELDITEAVVAGAGNLLAVRVLNPTNERIDGYRLQETPHRNKTVPPRCGSSFNSGGILYPVELVILPAVRIADLFARPDAASGIVAVTVSVRNDGPAKARGSLRLEAAPAATGEPVAAAGLRVSWAPGLSEHELVLTVPQPRLWNLDDPFLYRVTASLQAGGCSHRLSVRCGFRFFQVINGWFHLNGRRIFVRSTHTGNHMPIGQQVAGLPDHVRRDMLFAKAAGFNMVRFIGGVAYPAQLDCCDEIGLMVYEESFAGWCMEDSPAMGERFDRNTRAMILRDRNHPCVTIWGLLNETRDGPVFRHAAGSLPLVRAADPTRLVLLSSGRWDAQPGIGSVCNPGSSEWEHEWGIEAPGAPPSPVRSPDMDLAMGYFQSAGDAHTYTGFPQSRAAEDLIRRLGRETKPVFLSEYGIGSLMDVIREWRGFRQANAGPGLEDAAMLRTQSEKLNADWKRWGFTGVYPFAEDMLRESQRLHARQRTHVFDLVRANPRLCGYSLTGMLDHGMTGEGLWTFWREWKPATFDAVRDGWSPLRWCLFVRPLHGYRGRPFQVEAVLATEDVLPPGEYPAALRIRGPDGVAWEQAATIRIPAAGADGHSPLAVPVLAAEVRLDGPPGEYVFAASMEDAAPAGGRLTFHLSDAAALPALSGQAAAWGLDREAAAWLDARGLRLRSIEEPSDARELILVGLPGEAEANAARWRDLTERITRGAVGLFLEPKAFAREKDTMHWCPLPQKGACVSFFDWLYHKECVANRHPVFEGLPGPGIMDWDYYGPIIPREMFEGLETPEEAIAAAFATGSPSYPDGYCAGLLIAACRLGAGRVILSTPRLLSNLDAHPAADRMLVNLIAYARRQVQRNDA